LTTVLEGKKQSTNAFIAFKGAGKHAKRKKRQFP